MDLSEDYRTARKLAKALNTDGSLVGKWLNGGVKQITSRAHLKALPTLLKTPPDYFQTPSRADRLAEVEARVAQLTESLDAARQAQDLLRDRVLDLERLVLPGPVPDRAEAPAKKRARRTK
jgi:transcriptional regulator with XRE-family HTH domain